VREGRASQFPRTRDATESEGFSVISVSCRTIKRLGFRRSLGVRSQVPREIYCVHVIVTQPDDNNIE